MRVALFLLALLCSLQQALADTPLSLCGLPFDNVYDLREKIEAKKLKPRNAKDGKTYFYAESWAQRVWNLTRPEHPAHPAVICFSLDINKDTAKATLNTTMRCTASIEACDAHASDFDAYNKKLLALIQQNQQQEE